MDHNKLINFYGKMMIDMAKELYPINRSITGEGLRKTLGLIKKKVPLKTKFFKSGKKVFDWTIPKEWHIKSAYILDLKNKKKYANFDKNNLHIVGYSQPINKIVSINQLKKHIHIDKKNKTAIPYVTSYYKKTWGFCLSQNELKNIRNQKYRVVIDSYFKNGVMNYGELLLKGKLKKEILFSTYICHPSMANNELSGPVINTALINYVNNLKNKKYSYRFIFVPETIGSIAYINKNLKKLKSKMLAGFIIHCAGDDRKYSFVQTPQQNTFAETVIKSSFIGLKKQKIYEFKDRSSDERQYCSPKVDLPLVAFSRSKEFPEYHTNKDNFDLVTEKGLEGSLEIFKNIISAFETNLCPKTNFICEPNLGKRNLYPTISKKGNYDNIRTRMHLIANSDGKNNIFEISLRIGKKLKEVIEELKVLKNNKIIS